MQMFWNSGGEHIIAGLDILGFRKVEQDVEKPWVSGITTISARARYFAFLPWILMEYYQHRAEAPGPTQNYEEELRQFLVRLELIVVMATRHMNQRRGEQTRGVLGSDLFEGDSIRLESGEAINLTAVSAERHRVYGTYLGPCRAIGLLGPETLDNSELPKVLPRGREIFETRRNLLGDSRLRDAILEGGQIDRTLISKEATLFSVAPADLQSCKKECELLREAFLDPVAGQDKGLYERFRQTVCFVLSAVSAGRSGPQQVITQNYCDAISSGTQPISDVRVMWASYELYRRVHYALELLLQAVTQTVCEYDGADLQRVLSEWRTQGISPATAKLLSGTFTWEATVDEIARAIRPEAFSQPLNRRARPSDMAAWATVLLVSTWQRTSDLRARAMSHAYALSGANRVFPILDEGREQKLIDVIPQVLKHGVVEPHMRTTLKKMGQGLRCSLRFFPDGNTLRPTKKAVIAGFSGDRLTNVAGILADLGFLSQHGQDYSVNAEGQTLLTQLREPLNA